MHSPYSLQLLNSFKVPAFAAHYIRLNSLQDIEDFCAEIDVKHNQFYILGGGSNTLFCGTFPGYVLHVQLPGIEIIEESACKVLVKAAAGVRWHHLVLFCVNKGYGGIENLSLIPGTVGGAPIQNIGAYGVAFQDVVASIDAIEWSTRQKRVLNPTACGFGYRTSFFKTAWKNQYIITSVTLALHKGKKISVDNASIEAMLASMGIIQPSSKAISDAVIAIRKKKLPDPAFLGNAGSFFENPLIGIDHYRWLKQQYPSLVAFSLKDQEQVKISAAWLIETAGFKGFRQGDAGVYPLHALVLVNYGGATGQDIIHLANQIKQKVKNQFNITLRTEVNIV